MVIPMSNVLGTFEICEDAWLVTVVVSLEDLLAAD
jgi:hypothetical protein